jgi:hypothetical protein
LGKGAAHSAPEPPPCSQRSTSDRSQPRPPPARFPGIPKGELLALKRSIGELASIGRNINQIAKAVDEGGRAPGSVREEFRAMLKVCEALRDNTKALLKANVTAVVKVLPKDSNDLGAAGRHLDYIGRYGKLEHHRMPVNGQILKPE